MADEKEDIRMDVMEVDSKTRVRGHFLEGEVRFGG